MQGAVHRRTMCTKNTEQTQSLTKILNYQIYHDIKSLSVIINIIY